MVTCEGILFDMQNCASQTFLRRMECCVCHLRLSWPIDTTCVEAGAPHSCSTTLIILLTTLHQRGCQSRMSCLQHHGHTAQCTPASNAALVSKLRASYAETVQYWMSSRSSQSCRQSLPSMMITKQNVHTKAQALQLLDCLCIGARHSAL